MLGAPWSIGMDLLYLLGSLLFFALGVGFVELCARGLTQ